MLGLKLPYLDMPLVACKVRVITGSVLFEREVKKDKAAT
jgi:hypothetical protein